MDEKDFLLEQWKMAAELHQHEVDLVWQRFSYFVTLTGILVSGLALFLTADKNNIASDMKFDVSEYQYASLMAVSFFGAIISLAFASIFKRAYLYHKLRTGQAELAEKRLQKIFQVDNRSLQSTREKKIVSQFSVYRRGLANDLLSKLQDGKDWVELCEEKGWSESCEKNPSSESDYNKKRRLGRCSWCFARPGTYNVVFCLSLFMVIVWVGVFIIGLVLLKCL